MEKIKYIQSIMPNNCEILVRTEGKNKWFVHYSLNNHDGNLESIYKIYTENLDSELDKIINIILK